MQVHYETRQDIQAIQSDDSLCGPIGRCRIGGPVGTGYRAPVSGSEKTAASEPAATPETIKIVPDDIRWADSDQKATSQVYLEKSRTLFIKYSMITPAEAA